MRRHATTPFAKAVAKLDAALSLMIRADAKTCITCGGPPPFDCGHFRWREQMSTRFAYKNLAPQCWSCNRYQGGRPYEFSIYIDKRWGHGTAKELYRLSQKLKSWDIRELEQLTSAAKMGFNVYRQLYDSLTDVSLSSGRPS
jgi:hypothetical protein